jgi:hypothetical protein
MAGETLERTHATPRAAPRLTILQAVQRNPPLVALPVLALVVIALVVGLLRPANYDSDTQLNVGGVNLTVQSIPGYSVAVAQLAVAYSRAIDATSVVDQVSHATGLPTDVAIDRISATPVEGSPVIRIDAKGSSPQAAEQLANAAANALVKYAGHLNRSNPDTPRLLHQYEADSNRLRAATSALDQARDPSARKSAQTRVDLARLQQGTDAILYQQSQLGGATTSFVQQLAPAMPATSDRSSVLQRLVAAAIVAGLLIGVGLAVARANRLARRRIARV